MKQIMLVVGARPNLMKAAALMVALANDSRFAVQLVHTGQHYDQNMSKIFFKELALPEPDMHLGIGTGTPTQQIAHILLTLEPKIHGMKPDMLIVVGDVNSTLAAALAANKLSIPLAHVEAGLRSFDRTMPEEFNRILTDNLADYLFTPSRDANENLLRENISPERVFFVGNVMVDTLLRFRAKAYSMQAWREYNLHPKEYALLTLHRPANVDDRDSLVQMLDLLETLQVHLPIVFPTHPRTRARLEQFGLTERFTRLVNLVITPPLGYLTFVSLMTEARVVLTDSGGVQEETTTLGIPCLTLRANTERPVTITQGTNRLVGTSPAAVLAAFKECLSDVVLLNRRVPELWDGQAAYRIVEILAR